jgi:transposase-like protein
MKMGMEFWMGHVAAAKLEAISASEYSRRHGISVAALYYWQRKLRAATADTPKEVSKQTQSMAQSMGSDSEVSPQKWRAYPDSLYLTNLSM